jgi:hypothetical protein
VERVALLINVQPDGVLMVPVPSMLTIATKTWPETVPVGFVTVIELVPVAPADCVST